MNFAKKVNEFLISWTQGVIDIGRVYKAEGDYKKTALAFIENHYAFDRGDVLFKPTFTKEIIFRNSIEQALSYFVGGMVAEDNGFALRTWEKIDLIQVSTIESIGAAMGLLNFKPVGSDTKTKVAFTFILDSSETILKIRVHHSSPIL